MNTPVICVDGPSGAGKGTLARRLAQKLSFAYLDSGAIYRVLAVLAQEKGLIQKTDLNDLVINDQDRNNIDDIVKLARNIRVKFVDNQVMFEGKDLSSSVRLEETAGLASKLASSPEIRAALVESQKAYAVKPGLVADGRDMGTAIFPDAPLKIYLVASAEERAKRRMKQLEEMAGIDAGSSNGLINKDLNQKETGDSLRALVKDIESRDQRDMNRASSPLRPADDAIQIDCTSLSADQVIDKVFSLWESR